MVVELGDGNDYAYTLPSAPNVPLTFDGGAGTDKLKIAAALSATLIGGDGKDELESEIGADVLRGGEGDGRKVTVKAKAGRRTVATGRAKVAATAQPP
ncbi:MAG: hypothetical protein ACSLFR_09615 [Solirubrobacteraceae bacterium]